MIITKKEAKTRFPEERDRANDICPFHQVNPDQEGVYHCPNCIIIQDPCGCDEDMACELCEPEEFAKRGIFLRQKEAWEEA